MVWGTDRIDGAYSTISALATKPTYLMTFNEPNYAFGGGTPSNVVDPVTAAGLWPQLMSKFNPLGIQLIAPSPIHCAGDPNCHNVGTAAGWLSQFRDVSPPTNLLHLLLGSSAPLANITVFGLGCLLGQALGRCSTPAYSVVPSHVACVNLALRQHT